MDSQNDPNNQNPSPDPTAASATPNLSDMNLPTVPPTVSPTPTFTPPTPVAPTQSFSTPPLPPLPSMPPTQPVPEIAQNMPTSDQPNPFMPAMEMPQATTPTTDFNPFSQAPTPPPVEPTTPIPEPQSMGGAMPGLDLNQSSNMFSSPNTQQPVPDMSSSPMQPSMDPASTPEPFTPPDPAPTDLSHLIDPSANNAPTVATPSTAQPETLIVPDGNESAPSLTQEDSGRKIPKWVIGIAVALLLIVVAASAYFILGIGQTAPATSIPATTTDSQLQPPPQALPTQAPATPIPATSSGTPSSFGNLNESPANPAATPSASPKSAADLLRNR